MSLSLDHQLLKAALLCGMTPDGPPVYRLQLFFVANRDLGSKSHQSDFQRALQTAVDIKGFFVNAEGKRSGEYLLTAEGQREAHEHFEGITPKYLPKRRSSFSCTLTGEIAGKSMQIRIHSGRSKVLLDGETLSSAKEACQRVETLTRVSLPTGGTSAARVLQDHAIDQGFQIEFE